MYYRSRSMRFGEELGCAIPEVYRDFLMNVSNGLNVMNCTLALHGCRTSYNRADFESRYPFNIEDVQKYERPKNATPEMFFFASYNYDGSNSISIRWMIRYTIVTVTTQLH